ncbi:MAG: hypothetical protein QM737_08110 [Ferruginibacter sp.]
MRLIQTAMEDGDMEEAKKIVASIKFPGLLIKPVRSVYYTIKGNIDMMDQNFDSAEVNMKKSLALGGGQLTKQAEGPINYSWACWPCKKEISKKRNLIYARPSVPGYRIKRTTPQPTCSCVPS